MDRYLFGIVGIVGAVIQFVAVKAGRSEGAIDFEEGMASLSRSRLCCTGLRGFLGVGLGGPFRHDLS